MMKVVAKTIKNILLPDCYFLKGKYFNEYSTLKKMLTKSGIASTEVKNILSDYSAALYDYQIANKPISEMKEKSVSLFQSIINVYPYSDALRKKSLCMKKCLKWIAILLSVLSAVLFFSIPCQTFVFGLNYLNNSYCHHNKSSAITESFSFVLDFDNLENNTGKKDTIIFDSNDFTATIKNMELNENTLSITMKTEAVLNTQATKTISPFRFVFREFVLGKSIGQISTEKASVSISKIIKKKINRDNITFNFTVELPKNFRDEKSQSVLLTLNNLFLTEWSPDAKIASFTIK